MRRLSIVTCLSLVLLAACGGGGASLSVGSSGAGSSSSGGSSSGGSSGGGITAASITIRSSVPTIPADGSSGATITATATDKNGIALPGVSVAFTASPPAGSLIVVGNYTTNSSGVATATLTSNGAKAGSSIDVTATSGSLAPVTTTVQVVAATSGAVTVSMGSGTGSSFQQGVIAISTATLSNGGSTSLQVNLIDQTGAPYTTSTTVTFSSPCVGQKLATITGFGQPVGTPTVTTTSGTATATYVAAGCSGSDLITATATPNGQNLTASGSVTVSPADIGSIKFISATPTTITLKGLGSAGGSSTSTVVFEVRDTGNGIRPGATVDFSLSTTVGGVTLTPSSGVTDANGRVQTVISSGTVAEPVTVKASTTITPPAPATPYTISTESNSLTISTGIPASAGISLAVQCHNVEAWNIDGVTVPVTVRMRDRFTNPVPDGTTVNFHTLLGHIDSSCQTTGGTGTCTVNWVSQNPYSVAGNPQSTYTGPTAAESYYDFYSSYCGTSLGGGKFGAANGALTCNGTTNGRSPILAYAIGEESFVDNVGNGVFNSTQDTVAWNSDNPWNNFGTYSGPYGGLTPPSGAAKSWQDVGDPFLNQWELYTCYALGTVCDGIFVPGEFYYDFFNQNSWTPPDGLIESALCDANTTPAPSNSLCSTSSSTIGISDSNVIILSGSTPIVTFNPAPPAGGLTLPANLAISITDERYQQMPAGTTVSLAISPGSAGTINGPSSYTWPCSADIGGRTDVFSLSPPATSPTAGILTVTIKTPGGITTNVSYPLAN